VIEYAAFFPLEKMVICSGAGGVDTMSREEYVGLIEERQQVIREKVIDALGLEV